MTQLGSTFLIRGEIRTSDDLVIEGRVEGQVWAEGMVITVAENGSVNGEIIGRDITVLGFADGSLVASEVVDIRASANVRGRVVSARIILEDGGSFTGTVEPQHLHAALNVARHRHAS